MAAQSIWETITSSHRSSRTQQSSFHQKCGNNNNLKYLSGDALSDNLNCVGPDNMPYPTSAINRMYSDLNGGMRGSRQGRQSKFSSTMDPSLTQQALLSAYKSANNEDMEETKHRYSKRIFTFYTISPFRAHVKKVNCCR